MILLYGDTAVHIRIHIISPLLMIEVSTRLYSCAISRALLPQNSALGYLNVVGAAVFMPTDLDQDNGSEPFYSI